MVTIKGQEVLAVDESGGGGKWIEMPTHTVDVGELTVLVLEGYGQGWRDGIMEIIQQQPACMDGWSSTFPNTTFHNIVAIQWFTNSVQ